ncbi:MAG: hypothetical protein HFJ97_09185 [Eubacterium sp.]|nr:hypothetical protein [Eubacterium sp.]
MKTNDSINNNKIIYVRKDLTGIESQTDLYAEIVACRLFKNGIILFLKLDNGTIFPTEKFPLELTEDNPLTNLMAEFGPIYEAPYFDVQSLVGRMIIFNCQNDGKKIIITSMFPITDEWDDVV